eukprot:TRINITY_DN11960_c0_g1_i4.p1 TRINITY_DN11960_c0_g1~~TRINITY_DN11960_c0_g1_i4.p1  ORF type:complete len:512 (+),score=152.95 TRINITY_DN11960_c0_g1_i4:82-1617(+)
MTKLEMRWLIVAAALAIVSPPAIAQDVEADAVDYLKQYGYIDTTEGTNSVIDSTSLSDAVKKFQEFAGLDETGIVDSETQELMKTPRCGMDDRVANFVKQGNAWKKRELTWRIYKYPTNRGLSKRDVDLETRKAFNMWQEVSGMRFSERTSGSVDIEILFARGAHGDGNAFNGPGGVLAHAYFPGFGAISGDAHFDDAENWSVTPNRGNQLLNTLTHEFGHSLGLSHSNARGSIMAPFYKGWDVNLRLGQDDINGIQSLYGRGSGRPGTPERPGTPVRPNQPDPTSKPDRKDKKLCRSKIDTIVHTSDKTSYVFTGDEYYKLTNDNVAAGYPKKISRDWPGLPNNIDAAVTWKEQDVTYFFKGSQYWRFTGQTPSSGYPKDISAWQGLPSDLDAAFEWGLNNHLYFFKGSQYWKYDTDQQTMADGYPKDISSWQGVPSDIDAAFQWKNGKTYFFKSRNYWRFNDDSVEVDRANPTYPRNTGEWWFNCPKKPRKTIPIFDGEVEVEDVDTGP